MKSAAASDGMLSLTRDINPSLPAETEANIRRWATTCFEVAGGSGAPRIDFLSDERTGEVWLNEVNPCPGSFAYFLWEAAPEPVPFPTHLSRLIEEGQRLQHQIELPADPTPVDARLFKRP
jgi:D-alanine-D-alanine ligase